MAKLRRLSANQAVIMFGSPHKVAVAVKEGRLIRNEWRNPMSNEWEIEFILEGND